MYIASLFFLPKNNTKQTKKLLKKWVHCEESLEFDNNEEIKYSEIINPEKSNCRRIARQGYSDCTKVCVTNFFFPAFFFKNCDKGVELRNLAEMAKKKEKKQTKKVPKIKHKHKHKHKQTQ